MRTMLKSKPISLLLLIPACLVLLLLAGCPSGTPDDQQQDEPEPNGVETVSETPGVSPVIGDPATLEPEEAESEPRDAEAVDDEANEVDDETSHAPVTGYQPTEEEPFAPPADDAAGVENAPDNELSFIVSLKGTGDQVPLEDGASVAAEDSLYVQCSVVNSTEETVEFSFITGQKLDIFITGPGGTLAYQWSQDRRFAQVHSMFFLESGDIWSHELTVPMGAGGIEPGTYNFKIVLTGLPELEVNVSDVVIAALT